VRAARAEEDDESEATRPAVTLEATTPRRVESDDLGYLTVGYAATLGADLAPGPTLGGGYRYELDRFGVDAGLALLMAQRDAPATQTGIHAGIRGLFFVSPAAPSTAYVGAGLSFAAIGTEIDHSGYSGGGLAGRVSLGYELLRESTIRFILEVDAIVPAFTLERDEAARAAPNAKGSVWTTTLAGSLGIGWGGSRDRARTIRTGRAD
jgi:hypothetical protein